MPLRQGYIAQMESFSFQDGHRLFAGVDWKRNTSHVEPFPDMKLSVVKEVVSTGTAKINTSTYTHT